MKTRHIFGVKGVRKMKLDTYGHTYQFLFYVQHVNAR